MRWWFKRKVTLQHPGTRHRFTGFGTGEGNMSTHSPMFLMAYHAFAQGLIKEPEHTVVEVVTINTISGPRSVWADRVDEYKEVLK